MSGYRGKVIPGMQGPEMLRDWKRERRFTNDIIAEICGISGQTVNQWMAGRSRPSIYLQFVIEELTEKKVRPIHWLNDKEQATVALFRRQIRKLRNAPVKPPPTIRDKIQGRL